MKRLLAVLLAALLLTTCGMTVSAEETFVYVTDPVYSQIITGGVGDVLLFSAYEADGDYVIGTMNAEGELTRENYSSARWDELVEDAVWTTTVLGDAASLCPYAHTHIDTTVCPYTEIDLVTMKNVKTGVTLSNYYVPTKSLVPFPGTNAHICWGRYGYQSPETLKWDGESRYMSLKNSDGLWGIYDSETDRMVVDYQYSGMSAVYGSYAKVSDGEAWGRLDLSGATETVYAYPDEASFSIKEELRQLVDKKWQVFNADNEPVSAVFEGNFAKTQYAPAAHLLLVTNSDQTKTLYDLNGEVVATFDADTSVTYLQDACYAVSGATRGVALARADGIPVPDDTVRKADVNFDGEINSTDVRYVLRHTVGADTLTSRAQLAADVNDDGLVNTDDAREVLKMILFV